MLFNNNVLQDLFKNEILKTVNLYSQTIFQNLSQNIQPFKQPFLQENTLAIQNIFYNTFQNFFNFFSSSFNTSSQINTSTITQLLSSVPQYTYTSITSILNLINQNLINQNSGYINLSSATADYYLEPGQVAFYSFTSATSLPLHIATVNGSLYEMHIIPSDTGTNSGTASIQFVQLYPNNYNNYLITNVRYWYGYNNNFGSNVFNESCFYLGAYYTNTTAFITNFTLYKNINGFYEMYGVNNDTYPYTAYFSGDWQDTITPWYSLGTIVFVQGFPMSGNIIIKRLV